MYWLILLVPVSPLRDLWMFDGENCFHFAGNFKVCFWSNCLFFTFLTCFVFLLDTMLWEQKKLNETKKILTRMAIMALTMCEIPKEVCLRPDNCWTCFPKFAFMKDVTSGENLCSFMSETQIHELTVSFHCLHKLCSVSFSMMLDSHRSDYNASRKAVGSRKCQRMLCCVPEQRKRCEQWNKITVLSYNANITASFSQTKDRALQNQERIHQTENSRGS